MTRKVLFLSSALLVLTLSAAAHAGPDNGRGQSSNHGNQASQSHAGQHHTTVVKVKVKRAKPCPPGLAKKNTGCLPPGLWRKGDRLPDTWVSQFVPYGSLPDFYRNRYPIDPNSRYLYRDGRVVVVNAVTHIILDVLTR